MSQVEIHYVVTKAEQSGADIQQILSALEAHEVMRPKHAYQSIESDEDKDVAMLKLVEYTPDLLTDVMSRETAEQMRRAVETRFSDEDRQRLSQRFVGIAIHGVLDTE